jgi:uncharacterized membrane protein YraQ (UPF0718 family)
MGVKKFILNPFTKFVSVFLGFYYATGDIIFSLIVAVVFGLVLFMVFKYKENFEIITIVPDVYPGCVDVSVSDLVNLYGSEEELKRKMYELKVPLNLQLTDTDAPKIATYLMNATGVITQSCAPPK